MKFEFSVLVISLLLPEYILGATRVNGGAYKPLRYGFNSPMHTARKMPFTPPMAPSSSMLKPRMAPKLYGPPNAVRNYKPRQTSFLSQFPPIGSSDTQFTMSLDDAFKMGYQAGKTVAISDSLRKQGPMCGLGDRRGQCSPNIFNIFFPPQPIVDDEDSGTLIGDYINPGLGYLDPMTSNIYGTDQYGNVVPVVDIDSSQPYYSDVYGQSVPVDPVVPPIDPFVTTTTTGDQVLVNSDGSVTPAVVDNSGNVLVPVGSVDTTSTGDAIVPVAT